MKLARRRLLLAVIIFWVMVLAIILAYAIEYRHFEGGIYVFTKNKNPEISCIYILANSISWYVGQNAWSAILFAIVNCFVATLIGRFLWSLGEQWQMRRAYFFFVVLLTVAFIWLSVFPLGYFGAKSVISYLHQAGSRVLFFAMAVVAFYLSMRARSKVLRLLLGIFVLYAIVCAILALTNCGIFYHYILLFEASYIFVFMMLLLRCSYQTRVTC